MKLHTIKLHNIKSLIGTYILNLDERFGESELFLIHGPTGIGKTAIFDAVALTLFGQTPKLDGGAQGEGTNSIGWVMNELSGECWTELTFSILDPEGKREYYHARWELHRAGRKVGGAIQHVRRKLNRMDETGNVLEIMVDSSTLRDIDAAFEIALKGMTYVDFQQTILLPQNGFTAFIQAKTSERVDLLERITGTHHIAALCEKADDKRQAYSRQLAEETSRLIGVMTDAEVLTAKHNLQHLQGKLDAYECAQQVMTLGQDWEHHVAVLQQRQAAYQSIRVNAEKVQSDLKVMEEQSNLLQKEGEALKRDMEKMNNNRLGLDGELQDVMEQVQGLERDKERSDRLKSEIAVRAKELEQLERKLQKVVGVSSEEREQIEQERSTVLQEISNRVGPVTMEDYSRQVTARQRDLRRKAELCRTFIARTDSSTTLSISIQEGQAEITLLKNNLQQNVEEISTLKEHIQEREEHHSQVLTRLDKAREFFLWDKERRKLSEGDPCTLCGSLSHPYHVLVTPEKTDAALSKQKELQSTSNAVKKEIDLANNRLTTLMTQNKMTLQQVQRLEKNLQTMQQNVQRQQQEIDALVTEIALAETPLTKEAANAFCLHVDSQIDQMDALNERLNQASVKLTKMLQAQNQHVELLNQKQALQLAQDDVQDRYQLIEQGLQSKALEVKTVIQALLIKVNDVTKSNCAEQGKFRDTIRFLQNHLKTISGNWTKMLADWNGRNVQLQAERTQKEQNLQELLQQLQEQQKTEIVLSQNIDAALHVFKTGLDSMEALSIQWFEMDAALEEKWASLKDARTHVLEERSKCEQDLTTLRQRLAQYNANLERMKRIKELTDLVAQWADMHTLLNSHRHVVKDPKNGRGVRFREYAQIRQLQLLIQGANEHLSAMQTEYLLEVRKDAQGKPTLDFDVKLDSAFARPLTTLSGGQTFLVSLAFALALADLRKVDICIETLLIDEGFGSLDRNFVEMAVDTLEQLKHKGVQVGLISHVVSLQEKIAASVTVDDLKYDPTELNAGEEDYISV